MIVLCEGHRDLRTSDAHLVQRLLVIVLSEVYGLVLTN